MRQNIGSLDARIRQITAVALLAAAGLLAWAGNTVVALALAGLAVVFLATSRFRTCPLYMPFGFRTNKDGPHCDGRGCC